MTDLALRTAREMSRLTAPQRELRWPRNEDSLWSPADRMTLLQVVAERDELREQLANVRDLSDRLIDTCDAQRERIVEDYAACPPPDGEAVQGKIRHEAAQR